jgi:hypothetical protein
MPVLPVPPAAPLWLCPADCVVAFVLLAAEFAAALFCCDTAPSFPGLSTRTEMFLLLAPLWVAVAPEFASWAFWFDWPAAWVPVLPVPPAPLWLCPADCVVAFVLLACEFAAALFACAVDARSPGLNTRAGRFAFGIPCCCATAAA